MMKSTWLTALLCSTISLFGLSSCESTALQDILASTNTGGNNGALSNDTIARGLKEALTVGTGRVVDNLGANDGFFGSSDYRIPLPASLQKVKSAASAVGLGSYFDELELKMNRAAEAATPKARSLFVNAISQLTFEDVMGIYQGEDNAATQYLRGKMAAPLKEEMRPIINQSLSEVGAVKVFNDLVSRYNRLPLVDDIDANLDEHVLGYANQAIFTQLEGQEAAIRKDPVARSTALLRQVFGR
jgi:hypothetical protein